MTVIITELRNDLEPDRDPAFNPNVFSEDEEEAAQAAALPAPALTTALSGGASSKSAFQSVGRGAVVPPEPASEVNVAFCSVVTSPVSSGKRSPPPGELSITARNHVVVNGRGSQSPNGGVDGFNPNHRHSPISSSNTIVDLSAANDVTPTAAAPQGIAIAPALPGISVGNARRFKNLEGNPISTVDFTTVVSSNQPLSQRKIFEHLDPL